MIRFLLSLVLLACLALPATAQCGSRSIMVRGPWFLGKNLVRAGLAFRGHQVPPRWQRLNVVSPRALHPRPRRYAPNCPGGVCRMPGR